MVPWSALGRVCLVRFVGRLVCLQVWADKESRICFLVGAVGLERPVRAMEMICVGMKVGGGGLRSVGEEGG